MSFRWILLRVGSALVTLAFVLVFNFFLFRAVGDPKKDLARDPHLTLAGQQAVIHQRGLDQSEWVQFTRYVKDTLTFDLGNSFATGQPVSTFDHGMPSFAARQPLPAALWNGSRCGSPCHAGLLAAPNSGASVVLAELRTRSPPASSKRYSSTSGEPTCGVAATTTT